MDSILAGKSILKVHLDFCFYLSRSFIVNCPIHSVTTCPFRTCVFCHPFRPSLSGKMFHKLKMLDIICLTTLCPSLASLPVTSFADAFVLLTERERGRKRERESSGEKLLKRTAETANPCVLERKFGPFSFFSSSFDGKAKEKEQRKCDQLSRTNSQE